jgi:MFS family permease
MKGRKRVLLRILVGVFGAALVCGGLWVSLTSVIIGIAPQSPNPYVTDGDPCCAIPDTWHDTRLMAFWGWLWLGAGLVPIGAGLLIIVGAITDRPPRWRRLPIGVAAAMGLAAAVILVAYARLDEAPQVVVCRKAKAEVKAYRSATPARRSELTALIGQCDLLTGATAPEVRALLGPPARKTAPPGPITQTWHYARGDFAGFTVRFQRTPGSSRSTVAWASWGG